MDHSALLALKYISWFASFVFTRQLWLRFLEEGSSPLNFSGWAVTFWLVFTAIISAKVHSADSLAWVGDANRRRKFKIESVKAGRKTILRTSIWTMVPLLTLPRLSASCSKSDRSNAIVRTFVYAPSTPLLPRNWAKESETLEGDLGTLYHDLQAVVFWWMVHVGKQMLQENLQHFRWLIPFMVYVTELLRLLRRDVTVFGSWREKNARRSTHTFDFQNRITARFCP